MYTDGEDSKVFDDVVGNDEAKEELQDLGTCHVRGVEIRAHQQSPSSKTLSSLNL